MFGGLFSSPDDSNSPLHAFEHLSYCNQLDPFHDPRLSLQIERKHALCIFLEPRKLLLHLRVRHFVCYCA